MFGANINNFENKSHSKEKFTPDSTRKTECHEPIKRWTEQDPEF
jgi:hypothetical protein